MWAVLRDVSELRRSQRTLRETRDSLQRQRQIAQTEHRLAVELQEAVLPPWRGPLRLPQDGGPAHLDLAARYLPVRDQRADRRRLVRRDASCPTAPSLLDRRRSHRPRRGRDLGHGDAARRPARAWRWRAPQPGQLMAWLNQLLDATVAARPGQRPVLPLPAGHPHPDVGAGRTPRPAAVPRRDGARAGPRRTASCSAPPRAPPYGQADEPLEAGDLLLLHTDGLVPRRPRDAPDPGVAERRCSRWPRCSPARDRTGLRADGRGGVRRARTARTTPACSSPGYLTAGRRTAGPDGRVRPVRRRAGHDDGGGCRIRGACPVRLRPRR